MIIGHYGIDLRRWMDQGFSVSGFMVDPVLRAKVTLVTVVATSAIVLVATMLFSLLPARRAANVNITDTLAGRGLIFGEGRYEFCHRNE